ncbi:hypothetical protein N480_21575 [Pseudoalteromonas luteoviolacea S2607]|nr:hypothetical protein N480_21575 [Pseudoalteromonas luteoviolacea S2607]
MNFISFKVNALCFICLVFSVLEGLLVQSVVDECESLEKARTLRGCSNSLSSVLKCRVLLLIIESYQSFLLTFSRAFIAIRAIKNILNRDYANPFGISLSATRQKLAHLYIFLFKCFTDDLILSITRFASIILNFFEFILFNILLSWVFLLVVKIRKLKLDTRGFYLLYKGGLSVLPPIYALRNRGFMSFFPPNSIGLYS